MGFFGKQPRTDETETTMQEPYEDLPTLPEPPRSTVVALGATMTGALRGDGVIQVEGTVEGEIDLQGAVIIAPTGLIKGPITADVVRIAGRVEGPVFARERLLLQKTGSLEGDMTTPALEVEDGGRLNGRSTMPPAAQQHLPQATQSE